MSTAARNLRPSHHTSGSPTSSQLNRPSPDAEFSASSIAFSIARSGVDPNEQPLKSADALADVAVTASTVSDAAPIVSRTPIRRAQVRRFATEAAEVVLWLGFANLGLHRIIGRLDARDIGSARVLAKLGMRREAHFVPDETFKGEWSYQLVYAIIDEEWKARPEVHSAG
jgi:Acetyltransferase (GNAT) domain